MLNVLNITLQGCGIDMFEATSEIDHLSKNLKVWKKKSAVTTHKICRRFRPSCLHVNGKKQQNLEHRIIEVASCHVNVVRDSF